MAIPAIKHGVINRCDLCRRQRTVKVPLFGIAFDTFVPLSICDSCLDAIEAARESCEDCPACQPDEPEAA